MKYIEKDLGSYNLHIIKTKKFKSIVVRVNFRCPIVKEEITLRNFLTEMLLLSSKEYPSKREIALKSQDLYASTISVTDSRIGNYTNTNYTLNILNDRYTEEGNLKDAIEFLSSLIYKPNVSDNKFMEKELDIIKKMAISSLESVKEDPANYALIRLYENMDIESPLSYRPMGYMEDLEKITTSNLYMYYKNMLKTNLMDIFIVGDVDEDYIEKIITDNFKSNTYKKLRKPYRLEERKSRTKKLTVRENLDLTQAKLTIGCRFSGLSEDELKYALTLYNIILGSGGDSKLFKNVREKHSAAYYCSSAVNKLDNILLIRAGITKENLKKVVKLVEEEMQAMKKGSFTDSDMEKAKELYNTSLDEMGESPNRIISSYYSQAVLGFAPVEERKEKIAKVTREDIISVAKKVKIDTVYCLEGDK